ncbi:MAG: hypothetical protein P8013_04610 [Candidatus Sulfobium sp.]|jgi:hypothetical protein
MISKHFVPRIVGILLLAAGMAVPLDAYAGVNVNIGINLAPPAFIIHEPPPVAVIPGSYVYFVPGIRVDILFYRGYWYRPYRGRWYRGSGYNGPWHHIEIRRIPQAIRHLPPDYRHSRHTSRSIPYSRMKKNWRKWEREGYWDRREVRRGGERRRYDDRDRGRNYDGRANHGRWKDRNH